MVQSVLLARFEQKNVHLVQAEVDEVFGFMPQVPTLVPPHHAVPGGVVLLVKLLNMGRSTLLYVIFLQRLSSTFHGVLLHVL